MSLSCSVSGMDILGAGTWPMERWGCVGWGVWGWIGFRGALPWWEDGIVGFCIYVGCVLMAMWEVALWGLMRYFRCVSWIVLFCFLIGFWE